MNIQMPTDEEKRSSMQTIIDTGLAPERNTLNQLTDILRAVPLRYVCTGIEDSLFLALISAAIIYAGTTMILKETLYITLFALSPFLYAALYWLTVWKEFQTGTIELKMACRFNLRHMTAVRMLLFSTTGIIADMALAVIASAGTGAGDYLRTLAVCLSALFIYAGLSLSLTAASLKMQLALPAAWALMALLCLCFARNWFNTVLIQIPLYLLFIILTASLLLFIQQFRGMIADSSRGGVIYADN